jgi:hypothetical protein
MQGCRLLILILASGLASGCQLGRTMFQMDSNSRTPFFGFDLLGQNESPKEQDVRASSVADLRNGPKNVNVQTVAETTPPKKKASLLEKLSLKRTPERIPLQLAESEGELPTGPKDEFQ